MSESCCSSNNQIMILACSGGSNVGQLSNQAAVELTKEGFCKMFCLAGVGAHLGGFVQSAKDVSTLIAIDGCSVGCTKAILEHAQVPLKNYVVITDLGIEKNKDFNLKESEINEVKKAVKQVYAKDVASKMPPPNMGTGCCCSGKC